MSNHEEDKLFKYATKEDGFSFINLIEEINWDIRKYDFKSENLTFNPTELIELDPAVYKSDMIMELDSIIVITEFQSTVVKKFDEKRYRLYTAIVDYAKQNNKPILLIVFSTAEKTKIKQYKLNKDCVFTIPIISLKDFDGDEIRIKIEAASDGSTPGGRNPANSGDVGETGDTGNAGDEDAPSFTTREEYNKILKDMGFNRTRI